MLLLFVPKITGVQKYKKCLEKNVPAKADFITRKNLLSHYYKLLKISSFCSRLLNFSECRWICCLYIFFNPFNNGLTEVILEFITL